MTVILPTKNPEWGFWGTCRANGYLGDGYSTEQRERLAKLWVAAFRGLCSRDGWKPENAREFLDSRWGRHFADDLSSLPEITPEAVERLAGAAKWIRRP